MGEIAPWRGPGPGRPELPLPPERMPLRRGGRMLKQWLYVAAFAEEAMLCAARVRIGPAGQTFWAILDRDTGELHENTRLRLPGGRGEVWREQDAIRVMAGKHVRATLRPQEQGAIEVVCPTDEGHYTWTRKCAGFPLHCQARVRDRHWKLEAGGVSDESAGYHPRHTVWSWSAGVGRSSDGRSVGWNLVSGINDPAERSERAIWVDGEPVEPGPVEFEGLEAIAFEGGPRVSFEAEAERAREENLFLVRYSYRQPFGRFAGTMPGGLELEHGLGVMEHHDAVW